MKKKVYEYYFTITTHTYYRVKARSLEEAEELINEADDLADFWVNDEMSEVEFYGSTEPEKGD